MRLVNVFVVALIALLISSMGLAAPAGANVDQCAPPGVESASALPTPTMVREPPVLLPTAVDRDAVIRRFGAERGEACWRELEPKRIDRDRAEQLNARLVAGWDAMRDRIRGVALGAGRIHEVLTAAGAPVMPPDLGWPDALFEDAVAHAREIRNRYTFLDFAADLAPPPA